MTDKRFLIHSSHLALRFYEREGWTREILEPLFKADSVQKVLVHQDSGLSIMGHNMGYFIADVGSQWDIERLMEKASGVQTYKGEYLEGEKAKEYCRSMNW